MYETYYPKPTEAQEFTYNIANLPLDEKLATIYSAIENGTDEEKYAAADALKDINAEVHALVQEIGPELDITSNSEEANRAAMLLAEFMSKAEFIARRTGKIDETMITRPEIEEDMQSKLASVFLAAARMSGRTDFTHDEVISLKDAIGYQTKTAYELIMLTLTQAQREEKEVTISPAMKRHYSAIAN